VRFALRDDDAAAAGMLAAFRRQQQQQQQQQGRGVAEFTVGSKLWLLLLRRAKLRRRC